MDIEIDGEVLERAADIIIGEVDNYNKKINRELKEESPETYSSIDLLFMDPKTMNIANHFSNTSYREFIYAILVNYLKQQIGSQVKVIGHKQEAGNWIDVMPSGFNWGGEFECGAYYSSKHNAVFTNFLPDPVIRKIENDIKENIEDEYAEFIAQAPKAYNQMAEENSHNKVKRIMAHEATHNYIYDNTKWGSILKDNNEKKVEGLTSEEINKKLDSEGSMLDQIMIVGHNSDVEVIIEAPAYAIILVHKEQAQFTEEFLQYLEDKEIYDKPKWILEFSKFILDASTHRANNKQDWIRKLNASSISLMTQKGQVDSAGNKINPVNWMAYELLTEKERSLVDRVSNSPSNIMEGVLSKKLRNDVVKNRILGRLVRQILSNPSYDARQRYLSNAINEEERVWKKYYEEGIIPENEFRQMVHRISQN